MKEMYMEDVGSISAETCEFITNKLKGFKTRLSDDQVKSLIENEIFDEIFKKLETFCDNDYRQHN